MPCKRALLAALFLLPVIAHAETTSKLAARGYAIVPQPQQVDLIDTDTRFGPDWYVSGDTAQLLREEMQSRFALPPTGRGFGIQLRLKPGSVIPGQSTDPDKEAIAAQSYQLTIDKSTAIIAANAPEGLFYGIETFIELLRKRDGVLWLPQLRITDWPDLHLRHIYWDDAHHLDRLPDLKRAIRQAAFYKINGLVLKLEGHFQFKSAPALVEPYALTPAEYQELTDYALRYHVQLIPYLDGPAHIAFILKHPEYAKYRSFPDSNYELCVANPEAVKFLSGMFQDLLDANKGNQYVYLSTDEPYYVGMADNPQCQEKGGAGKLLADFTTQIAAPMHQQGRTVMFWGESPLKPADIDALPSYLVNAETYGPEFDPVFHQHGIRQMIYTSTQAGTARLFPDYFPLPDSRRVHPLNSQEDRIETGVHKISSDPARGKTDIIGAVVAGWADMGLHPETFWVGYATITAAAWKPAPTIPESMAAFYRTFYGDSAVNMNRIYQLMSQQAHFWLDSWEWAPSSRKPIFGNSYGIFNPRHSVRDQTLPLPPAGLTSTAAWLQDSANIRRLQLAADFLADNDELLGLLEDNLARVDFNRYNLEVYIAIAQIYRQNLEMLLDIGRMGTQLQSAQTAVASKKPKDAVAALDRVLALAAHIRARRDAVLEDATATFYKSWFPRVAEANGRKFLHELDDVKDHVPDRTVDMSYLIDRELQLPFGPWVESIRIARNQYAAANNLPQDPHPFEWKPTKTL
jgi:hexosaminidase